MNYFELKEIVTSFIARYNQNSKIYVAHAGLPRAIQEAAILAFINQTPEDELTKVIRHQLHQLQSNGQFDLEKDE